MSAATGAVRLHRVLRAPADRVYKAFVDGDARIGDDRASLREWLARSAWPALDELRGRDAAAVAARLRPLIAPQTTSTMMAPTTAPISPAPCPGAYQPRDWPR